MRRLKLLLVLVILSFFSFSLIVKANEADQVEVTFTHVVDGEAIDPITQKYNIGDTVTVNMLKDEDILFYVVNSKVRLDIEAPYTFTAYNNTDVKLVYASESKKAVTFMDTNLDHLKTVYVDNNGDPAEPSLINLTKAKSVFKGWVLLEDYNTEVAPLMDVTSVTENSIFVAKYELDVNAKNEYYDVVIDSVKTSHLINEVVTATATAAPEGEVFSHWEDEAGNVLSINPTYKFTVLSDTVINAVYAEEKMYTSPIVNMSNALSLRDGYVSFKGQFELSEGQELVEHGFIFGSYKASVTYGEENVTIARSNVFHNETKEFLTSFPENNFSVIRAYIRYKDLATGEIRIAYSQNVSYSLILEEDFESTSNWSYSETTFDSGYYTWLIKETRVDFDDSDKSSATEENGEKVLRLRGANDAYMMSEQFDYVSKIVFVAKYYNESHTDSVMKISYQVAGSTDWTLIKTITLTDSYKLQEVIIDQFDVKIRIDVTTKSANIDNLKVYGRSVPKSTYTVSFDLDYEGAPSIEDQVVKQGFYAIRPNVPTRNGYSFVEWQLEDGTAFDFATPITEDITLKALWQENVDTGELVVIAQSDFGETNNSNTNYSKLFIDFDIENGSLDPSPNENRKWDYKGGNMNNTGWDYIRMGGKSASTKDSPSVYLQTKFNFTTNINKIVIKIVALDSANGDETIYLQTSSDGTNWTDVANKVIIVGDLTFDNLTIASGNYFRFVFERNSTSSNAGTDIKTITFYGNPQ